MTGAADKFVKNTNGWHVVWGGQMVKHVNAIFLRHIIYNRAAHDVQLMRCAREIKELRCI